MQHKYIFINASTDNTLIITLSIKYIRHNQEQELVFSHQKDLIQAKEIIVFFLLKMSTNLESEPKKSTCINKSIKSNDSNSNVNIKLIYSPQSTPRNNSVASSSKFKIKPPL